MRSTIKNIIASLKADAKDEKPLIVAIDGHGASGKSSLAEELCNCDSNTTLIHFDDFHFSYKELYGYDPNLPEFDWKRLEREVLIPLQQNKKTKYQRFDWVKEKLDDWRDVSPEGIIIIEGVSSINSKLRMYYDYMIWVDCPLKIRLERARARDKQYNMDTMELWMDDWIPRENNYIDTERPYKYADLIVDGSGQNADIKMGELNTLDTSGVNIDYLRAGRAESTTGHDLP